MPVTSLSLAKAHLAVDHDADDELLTHYLDMAEIWVAGYIGAPFPASPLATQATLLLVAHAYESREAVSFASPYGVPFGVHDLLSPLKDRVTGYVAPEPEPEPEVTE